MARQIWQDYDCPACGIDFDLFNEEILTPGEQCPCSGCGGYHTAGKDGPSETMLSDPFEIRELPRDATEKAAWILEAKGPPA